MAWVVHDAWDPTAHARTAHATEEDAYKAACFLLRDRLRTEVHRTVEALYDAMIESSEVQNLSSEAEMYEERLSRLDDRLKYYDAEHPHRDPRSWKQMFWRIRDEWKERLFENGARSVITVEHAGCTEVGAKRAREETADEETVAVPTRLWSALVKSVRANRNAVAHTAERVSKYKFGHPGEVLCGSGECEAEQAAEDLAYIVRVINGETTRENGPVDWRASKAMRKIAYPDAQFSSDPESEDD